MTVCGMSAFAVAIGCKASMEFVVGAINGPQSRDNRRSWGPPRAPPWKLTRGTSQLEVEEPSRGTPTWLLFTERDRTQGTGKSRAVTH